MIQNNPMETKKKYFDVLIATDETVNEYTVSSESGNTAVESCITSNETFGVTCENTAVERAPLVSVDDLSEENLWGSTYDETSACEWIVIDLTDTVKEL